MLSVQRAEENFHRRRRENGFRTPLATFPRETSDRNVSSVNMSLSRDRTCERWTVPTRFTCTEQDARRRHRVINATIAGGGEVEKKN